MRIYKIAAGKQGTDFNVNANTLWSSLWKLEETFQEILDNQLSFSAGNPLQVAKSLEMRNAFFVLDGHHRAIESIIRGQNSIYVHWSDSYPYIDAGIGNVLPSDKIKIIDFLKTKDLSQIKL